VGGTSSWKPGKPTGCNPLQRDPEPARIQFWEQLVRTCVQNPALPLLPADDRAIADAVSAVASMPRHLRPLSTVRQNLPKTGENSLHERSAAGARAVRSVGSSMKRMIALGDLHAFSTIGFDTTEFLDLPEVRTPVMMYLLNVMDELVDGERLIYSISEFWKALDNPLFSEFAKQKQKTIRKQNGLGIFDTQSPSDVLRHEIGRTMVEQSVTKIFLANPEAVHDEYVEGFGLSEAEFEIVRGLGVRGASRPSWSSRDIPARSASLI
jgi:type IV secretion system protein VirB4